jgi:formylglycine-generating enzyme
MKKIILNTLIMLIITAGVFAQAKFNNTDSSEMVLVSGGFYKPLFKDAADEEIKVEKFYLDVYPVANAEFLAFVKANPQWKRSNVKKIFADKNYLKNWESDFEPGAKVKPDGPVTFVSWFAAKAYAEWAGKRLPTVAEWEYAASAGSTKKYGADDEEEIKKILKWYSQLSVNIIPSVGSTEKNYWGVYDMHGLIWEWTYDFNTALVTGDSRGDGNLERNLFCGSGSANAKDIKNYPAFMRYGYRSSLKANYTTHNLGFRCAKDFQ